MSTWVLNRKSMADVVLKIIASPALYQDQVIGVSNPDTQNAPSAVY